MLAAWQLLISDSFIKAFHFEVVSKVHFLAWMLPGDIILCDGWLPYFFWLLNIEILTKTCRGRHVTMVIYQPKSRLLRVAVNYQ
jgi:hypothetical protein